MVAPLILAVTGGTGFVGSHLIDAALEAGHEVRALTRRPQAERAGVNWVAGSLEDKAALERLAAGAEAVIHVAGVLNVPTAADFEAGNVGGTRAMLDAAIAAGARRFVHVSSLAAREPQLSMYGASKARSETVVATAPISSVIVRPPAVYGEGDRETLDLFRMADRGLVLLPPAGRLSLIHARDLAELLLALAVHPDPPALVEPDDGRPAGWTHREFAEALGQAVGRKPLALAMPETLLRMGARIDRLVRGRKARLTPDRAAYFAHSDWVVDPARAVPPELWRPRIDTRLGLISTWKWYRENRWIRARGTA